MIDSGRRGEASFDRNPASSGIVIEDASPLPLIIGRVVKTLARFHREASQKGRKQSHSGDLARTRRCKILHIHQREGS